MGLKEISIGSKKPKKEITIDVKPKHYFYFFGTIFTVVLIVYGVLMSLGVYEVEEMGFECSNGDYEQITVNKSFYCGVHYSTLKGTISEKEYNNIERIINGE